MAVSLVVVLAAVLAVPSVVAVDAVGARVTLTEAEANAQGWGALVNHANASWVGNGAMVTVHLVLVDSTGVDVATCGANTSLPCASVAYATANALASCTQQTPVVVDVAASDTPYVC